MRTDEPSFDDRVRAIGGDPACFHCRAVLAVRDQYEAMPVRPDGGEILRCLAKMLGDHVLAVPLPVRNQALRHALACLAEHIGGAMVDQPRAPDLEQYPTGKPH